MLVVAVQYDIFRRTESATALGLVGLAAALPVIFLALPAGQFADRFDRRRIILVTQVLGTISSVVMSLVAAFGSQFPAYAGLVWAAEALQATATFFGEPGRPF